MSSASSRPPLAEGTPLLAVEHPDLSVDPTPWVEAVGEAALEAVVEAKEAVSSSTLEETKAISLAAEVRTWVVVEDSSSAEVLLADKSSNSRKRK